MSQQAHLWSRYHAAAIQTRAPEEAARAADAALAEYNKRFETLAKHEHEMAALALELEVRVRQVQDATQALMAAKQLVDLVNDKKYQGHEHFGLHDRVRDIFRYVNVVLQDNREYVIVPAGMDESDPRLGLRRRP
jgi:hypothetical protein